MISGKKISSVNSVKNISFGLTRYILLFVFSFIAFFKAFSISFPTKSGSFDMSIASTKWNQDLTDNASFSFLFETENNEDDIKEILTVKEFISVLFISSFFSVDGTDSFYTLIKNKYSNFLSSFQNREQISYVVLFHSWKLFPLI